MALRIPLPKDQPPLTWNVMFEHVQKVLEDSTEIQAESTAKRAAADDKPDKLTTYFPTEGQYKRDRYKKHVAFFEAGATYRERLFMKGNRVGGTSAGSFELACHLTGLYPKWWAGKRFDSAISAWACGTTGETTRDIVQVQLFGSVDIPGWRQDEEGMVPARLIRHKSRRQHGLAGALETVWVQHAGGGSSVVTLKAYEQGRESFEGTAREVIWCDEEPPEDCYTEMLFRTATTSGITFITFTPLKGRSKVVNGFLDPPTPEASKSKWYIKVGWKDVPHLSEQAKADLLATCPPYQIEARTEGEPALGAGAIYPIPESQILVNDFVMPAHWPKLFALDAATSGSTAAVWGAIDRDSDIIYIWSEYKRAGAEVPIHAAALRARGTWIPGVGDVAGVLNADGQQFIQLYRREGLNIQLADKAIEAGIQDVWEAFSTQRLRVFASCVELLKEYRAYHRDERGKIHKENDHLMDALRYLVRGRSRAKTKLEAQPSAQRRTAFTAPPSGGRSWAS